MDYRLIEGDSKEKLKDIPANSIDSIVTDPPYELGFMGKKWDSMGIAYDIELWKECLRVLKPGGHLLSFGGSRTYHRMACAIEDAGFAIRDQVQWVYGSGFPKSHNIGKAIDKAATVPCKDCNGKGFVNTVVDKDGKLDESSIIQQAQKEGLPWETVTDFARLIAAQQVVCEKCNGTGKIKGAEREVIRVDKSKLRPNLSEKDAGLMPYYGKVKSTNGAIVTAPATPEAAQWEGFGTALKPAHEPIVLARKPLSEKTIAENVLKWGTGGLNIDGCRVNFVSKADEIESKGKNQHTCYKNPNSNRDSYSGAMPPRTDYTAQGRFPANLIHDGSDEVVGMFPQTKSGSRTKDYSNPRSSPLHKMRSDTITTRCNANSGSAARFFYCAKASKRDRNEGCEGLEEKEGGKEYRPNDDGTKGIQSRLHGATKKGTNHHPTVKPTALMQYLCRLITPPGGTVLDPFMGSGSTGKACVREGFSFIGIDLTPEYVEIADARIKAEKEKLGLFSDLS